MGTWCQGCDAHRAGRAAEGSGKPALGGQQKGLEVELGGQGLREHPVWGIEGHLCTLPTLQFYRRVAPGLLGVGGTRIWQPPDGLPAHCGVFPQGLRCHCRMPGCVPGRVRRGGGGCSEEFHVPPSLATLPQSRRGEARPACPGPVIAVGPPLCLVSWATPPSPSLFGGEDPLVPRINSDG